MALPQKVKEGLQSTDLATVRKTLEDLEDRKVWDHLLKHLRPGRHGLNCSHPDLGRRWIRIVPFALMYAPLDLPRLVKVAPKVQSLYVMPKLVFDEQMWPLDAQRLDRFPGLTSLKLYGVRLRGKINCNLSKLDVSYGRIEDPEAFAGCTGLNEVVVESQPLPALQLPDTVEGIRLVKLSELTSLAAIAGARQLKRLRIWQCTQLERIDLSAYPDLVSFSGDLLEGCTEVAPVELPGLKRVRVSGAPHLRALAVSGPSLENLDLQDVGLHTLEGFPQIPEASFRLTGTRLENLEGLRTRRPLESLDLSGGSALTDLSALSAFPTLKHLGLKDCASLTDLSALASLTKLKSLDLRGCTSLSDLSVLGPIKRLRVIALHGSNLEESDLPASQRWAGTRDESPNFHALSKRKKPKAGEGPLLTQEVRDALLSDDAAVLASTLETLSPKAFADLVGGLDVDHTHLSSSHELLSKLRRGHPLFAGLLLYAPIDLPAAKRLLGKLSWRLEWDATKLQGRWRVSAERLLRITCPQLTLAGVDVTGLEVLSALTSVHQLNFAHCEIDFAGLAALDNLHRLSLTNVPFDELKLPENLDSLELKEVELDLGKIRGGALTNLQLTQVTLHSLAGIERWKGLSRVDLRDVRGLSSVIEFSQLPALTLSWINRCHDLKSLHGMPAMNRLDLSNNGALKDLRGLAASPDLEKLTVSRCANLTSLDGIEMLPALTEVDARGCRALHDVSALKKLPKLRLLHLEECASLVEIEVVRDGPIKAIGLRDSGVKKSAVHPDLRWRCTWKYGDLEKVAQKLPPVKASLPKGKKGSASALKKLLASKDVGNIQQGFELAMGLGSVEVFDALLDGAQIKPTRRHNIRGSSVVTASRYGGTYGNYVVLGLVAVAPEGSVRAAQIKEQVRKLSAYGTRNETGKRPFDPSHLAALPHLESVALDRVGPFLPGKVPHLPLLTEVHLQELHGLDDLWWLAGAPALHSIKLKAARLRSLAGLEGSGLHTFRSWYSNIGDTSALLAIESLREVHISPARRTDPTMDALRARGVKVHP